MGWFKIGKLIVDANGIATGSEDVEIKEGAELEKVCNHSGLYYIMANRLDWGRFAAICAPLYKKKLGIPVKDTRFFLAACFIQHITRLTDEYTLDYLYVSPDTQYFAGETKFQRQWAVVPEDLSGWKAQIGKETLKPILKEMEDLEMSIPANPNN